MRPGMCAAGIISVTHSLPEVMQVFTVCDPVVLAGEQVWHCGERVELDEVQGPGAAEQEVPLIQALQAEGHSQAR